VISQTVLIVASPFGDALGARDVARAIGRGLVAGGLPTPDLCPLDEDSYREHPEKVRARLDALDFDARMYRARAVVVGAKRLHERTLAGSITFEIATRARQGGVPAYAVTGVNELDAFDARMLDLQVVLEASTARGLSAAGRRLAGLV
jgi:glycerate kinase